jgi:hypothetical protein
VFAVGIFFAWRPGMRALRQVFTNTNAAACAILAAVLSLFVIAAGRTNRLTPIAAGMLAVALVIEAVDRRKNGNATSTSASA